MHLDKKRARVAWDVVKDVKGDTFHGVKIKEYAQAAQGLPVDIMSNGLLQALAFYWQEGKGKEHRRLLADQISDWLTAKGEKGCGIDWGALTDKPLVERLLQSGEQTYRRATEEALALIVWIKRFSKLEER